jgi:hypothetical protein
MKQKLIDVFTSKQAKRLYWNTANGLVGLGIVYVTDLNLAYGALIIAVLNLITKEINNRLSN